MVWPFRLRVRPCATEGCLMVRGRCLHGSTLAEAQCALMCLGRCLLKIFPLGRGAWQCRSLSSLHGCRSGSLTVDLSTSTGPTAHGSSCRVRALRRALRALPRALGYCWCTFMIHISNTLTHGAPSTHVMLTRHGSGHTITQRTHMLLQWTHRR